MSYNISFTPSAFEDYTNILTWFDEKSESTRLNFEKLMKEKLAFISKYPEASPEQYRTFRSLLLKKYQYKIYYRVEHRSLRIVIFAIVHTSRGDSFIRNRLNF
jgi:plasmid stabilization system protein ParE